MGREFSKLEKARTQIVLDHPFVASILLKHPIIEREDIPTAGVDRRGQIFVNPKWIETLTVPHLVYLLAHEVFHRIGQHGVRQGSRDRDKWNVACDAWINDTLDVAQIGTRVPEGVDIKGSKDKTCEDIYATLPPPQQCFGGTGGGQGGGSGKDKGKNKGKGGGGDGDNDYSEQGGIGKDLLDEGRSMTENEMKELAAEIKMEVAEAAQAAKMRGKLPAALADFANSIIEVKTPWYDILERFMTEKCKKDYTWTRPNRRYIGSGVYLPSMQSQAAMGELVVQVDVSGSVSERELNYYGGHLSRIVEQCIPEKVHVIYTDTRVVHHDIFDCGEEVAITFRTGGGTHMPAGYDYIRDKGIDPSVFVTLTDGYTAFPGHQEWPSIWCISSDVKAPPEAGETVHFEME